MDAKLLELSPAERVWLENQARKREGSRSKYVPHQGAREKAKRLARLEKEKKA